jgi:predicted pyridoxine 5'-phosphate oxidase superfamily flavin-nucleotide-binding protein
VPNLAIVVKVEKAFMHCSKCMIRSKMWNTEYWQDLSEMSSLAQIIKDHANLSDSINKLDELIEDSYTNQLY